MPFQAWGEGGARRSGPFVVATLSEARPILLGRIAGAHGLRGEVMIHVYTTTPEAIADYGPLSDEAGRRSFTIERMRVAAKGVVARLAGIDDRNAAEALKGTQLYVARDRLPPAADGEFYHADLVGLAAHDAAGTRIGEVVAVQNYGAGDLLELRLAGSATTDLIPFTDAFVPEVDLAAGRIVIVLPAATDGPP
jgi:16S rRNA processing protein RimM